MALYERDPGAIDPRTQGSAARTFFSFIAIMAILFAALTSVYLFASRETTVAQTEPVAPATTPSPAPPAAVPNPNPPPEPAPGQTVPDQGKPAEPGQPTPPGTGN